MTAGNSLQPATKLCTSGERPMSHIFFYGLFMNASLLRERGLHPRVVGPAELPMYRIRIGSRATLVPDPQSISYGMLIELSDAEATTLYSTPDVSDYRPDNVNTILLSDRSICPSLCYNLPATKLGATRNIEYAEQLSTLVLQLGFPPGYASAITRYDNE